MTGAIDRSIIPLRSRLVAVDGVPVVFAVFLGVWIATRNHQLGGILRRHLEVEELLPEHVVEAVEEPLLDGVHAPLEAVEQLSGVLVVHEEAIVEVEAVAAGVVHQPEQRLVPLGVDGRRPELEHREHPPHRVRQELRPGGMRVVLGAAHLHHPAPLALKDLEERLGAGTARRAVADADLVEHEGEAGPAVARRLRAEHGVGADDVELLRERAEEEVLGEFLDGEHVGEECVAAEAVEGERADDGLGGEDGCGEEHHVGVALAEVVRVGEEARAEARRGGGVVGAGVSQHGVALRHQRPRNESLLPNDGGGAAPVARRRRGRAAAVPGRRRHRHLAATNWRLLVGVGDRRHEDGWWWRRAEGDAAIYYSSR
nr:unnamed protein product [Digitaria exilis]